jgi:hypothetical protein
MFKGTSRIIAMTVCLAAVTFKTKAPKLSQMKKLAETKTKLIIGKTIVFNTVFLLSLWHAKWRKIILPTHLT